MIGAPYPRPAVSAVLIITGDRRGDDGHQEAGAELWRVPFAGWDELHELEATTWCRPRRYVVVDGLVRAAGYTSNDPTLIAGEVFRIRVPVPLAP